MPFSARDVALYPNGHTIAVVGYWETAREIVGTRNVIWIYELGSQGGKSLDATEGANYPLWSPDGRSLAFFADGKLKKLDISSGQVQTVGDAPLGRGGTWNKDGGRVCTPDADVREGLDRVSSARGT